MIAHLDIFSTFFYDIRVTPDDRIGLWLAPTNAKDNFLYGVKAQLDQKQVFGWKDL